MLVILDGFPVVGEVSFVSRTTGRVLEIALGPGYIWLRYVSSASMVAGGRVCSMSYCGGCLGWVLVPLLDLRAHISMAKIFVYKGVSLLCV